MTKKFLILFSGLALATGAGQIWWGCTSNPTTPDETDVVLRGYLYAQEPVSDIQLTGTNSIGSSDSTYPPITTASVALIKNDVRYGLGADASRPGYYVFAGSGLSVNTGDIFHIEVSYGGKLVTAQTIVPPKPEGMSMSSATMHFTKDSIQSPRGGYFTRITSSDTVEVSWSNASQDYYYIVIESADSAGTLIRDTTGGGGPFGGPGGGGLGFRFISQPTNQSSYKINPGEIQYTGKHVVKLYRINKEYADLYRSRMQDSRALNEPLTNVNNGLGVFSAFASSSMGFTVTFDP